MYTVITEHGVMHVHAAYEKWKRRGTYTQVHGL
jgi:hypothetical protein